MAQSRSPDSSVSISSLLASCRLGSSKRSSSFTPSSSAVEYKDRLYQSASDALEAYIQDYEESTGRINTHPTAALGFANKKGGRVPKVHPKPSCRRLCGARAPDLLSLTTDDLLGFPSDGSLPFSPDSGRKTYRTFRDDGAPALTSPPKPVLNARTHPSAHSFHSEHLRDLKNLHREQKRRPLLEAHPENLPAYYNTPDSPHLSGEPALPKSYPRWLTSRKSELGVSGISSIPDVPYPLWIRDYGLLGDSHTQITNHRPSEVREPPKNNTCYVSSLDPLRSRACEEQVGRRMVNPVGEHLPADLHTVGRLHTPPKDRTDRSNAFRSSRKRPPRPAEDNRSPQTEDVLEAERSWEQVPYSLKSPVSVTCEDEDMEGCEALHKSQLAEHFLKDTNSRSFSGGNHHGPVEALKHMLFNLQAFQHNFTQADPSENEIQKVYMKVEAEMQRVDQEIFPVNKSLQKALQHLSRLKELVGDGAAKQEQESAPKI